MGWKIKTEDIQISQSRHFDIQGRSIIRRYPPEWEKQKCVWLAYPHNKKEWGKSLDKIEDFYRELINLILKFQDVNLIFPNIEMLQEITVDKNNYRHKLNKIIIPNNDIWIRDYGPFFLQTSKRGIALPLVNFGFNAWGGKFPPWDLDNNVSKEIALYKGIEIESYPIVLEGGALEFSGAGVLLTTEECVLNKNRNKNPNKEKIGSIIKSAFNVEEIIWLKHGLANDHTDGHIDNVARFINSRQVLVCKADNKKDENYDRLQPNREALKKWKHPKHGYKFDVIELPLSDSMEGLPKSYANFIFVNGGIIVPVFSCNTDEKALTILRKLFPKRKIVGFDCSILIQEGGGLHCMTKQEI